MVPREKPKALIKLEGMDLLGLGSVALNVLLTLIQQILQ